MIAILCRAVVASLMMVLATTLAFADTLNEALVTTYLSNPELAAARARLRATDELVPQALARWRPQLFLDGTSEFVDTETDLGASDRLTSGAQLSVRQALYAGGGIGAAVDQAEDFVRAERGRLRALEQDILFEATEAYTATWRDRAVLELARNNESRLAQQLTATRDRFEVGEVARTDVAQAEARLARARADVEQAKADLAASAAAYRDIVGVAPGLLQEPMPLMALPVSQPEAQAMATSNPLVSAARFSLEAARDGVDVAFAELLPDVDLTGELSYFDEPTQAVEWQRQASVGIDVSVPIYQGGLTYSRIRESRQDLDEQEDLLADTLSDVQRSVTSSWEGLLAARAAIQAFREEVEANRIALQGVQEEALVGQRTVLDVLDAQQELFESRVNLVRAQSEEVVASYRLKQAVGELMVATLDLDVAPYDDVAYYQRQRSRLFGIDIE